MFKVYRIISPPTICKIFNRSDINYELRKFSVPYVRSVYHGTESISYLDRKIWETGPNETKELASCNSFKDAIKK